MGMSTSCPDCGGIVALICTTPSFFTEGCIICGWERKCQEGHAFKITHGTIPTWLILHDDVRYGLHPYDASRHYHVVNRDTGETALVTASPGLAAHVRDLLESSAPAEEVAAAKNGTPPPIDHTHVTLGFTVGGDIGHILRDNGALKDWKTPTYAD